MLPPRMPPLNSSNQFGESFKIPSQDDIPNPNNANQSHLTPPSLSQCEEGSENYTPFMDSEGEYGGVGSNNSEDGEYGDQTAVEAPKPSITELMRNPSKVVLCKLL
jgi:hypothetical protein